MIRLLAPLPASFDINQVKAATMAAFPKALDVNVVVVGGAPNAALYFNDGDGPAAGALTTWRNQVAAHVPAPPVVAAEDDRIAQVQAKADAILADPVNAADWTAGERKVILAALLKRIGRGA